MVNIQAKLLLKTRLSEANESLHCHRDVHINTYKIQSERVEGTVEVKKIKKFRHGCLTLKQGRIP